MASGLLFVSSGKNSVTSSIPVPLIVVSSKKESSDDGESEFLRSDSAAINDRSSMDPAMDVSEGLSINWVVSSASSVSNNTAPVGFSDEADSEGDSTAESTAPLN